MSRTSIWLVLGLLGLACLSCGTRTGLMTRSAGGTGSACGTDSELPGSEGGASGRGASAGGQCPAPSTLCGSGKSAGCAVLESDAMNCGACGRACAPGISCVAGACQQRKCTDPVTFQKIASYPAALSVNDLQSEYLGADMNRDGHLDLLEYTIDESRELAIWLGHGDGTFAVSTSYSTVGTSLTPNLPGYAAVGDFNEDGLADLVVTKLDDLAAVSIRPGLRAGGLGGHPGIPFSRSLIADLDGDGHLDVVTTAYSENGRDPNRILVLRGRGNGTFASPRSNSIYDGAGAAALRDWDGDGILDILAVGTVLHILRGKGDGDFAEDQRCAVGGEPGGPIFADLNQDGKVDMLSTMWPDQRLGTVFGQGGCNFTPRTDYVFSFMPGPFVLGDLDGDGLSDLVVAGRDPKTGVGSTTALLTGIADGKFVRQPDLAIDSSNFGNLFIADVNSDGHADLVCTGTRGIEVYANACVQ
jgi:hypothetical protein